MEKMISMVQLTMRNCQKWIYLMHIWMPLRQNFRWIMAKESQDPEIADINLIKPGIGETTRVLLRRIPWKILLAKEAKEDASLMHILRLAEEKGVPVETVPLRRYKACGLIQTMADT